MMINEIKLLDIELFPPLLKRFSWTKAAPYKEERFSGTVSDAIGHHFSPLTRNLKQDLINLHSYHESHHQKISSTFEYGGTINGTMTTYHTSIRPTSPTKSKSPTKVA